jgi:hypothetical protein
MTAPKVELLLWSGCPSHPRALADLREAMGELGMDPEVVVVREVTSDEQAQAEGFVGSPTIRIDGLDIQPPPEGEPTGLTCRIYHRRDGRVSPTPDPLDVRGALRGQLLGANSPEPTLSPSPLEPGGAKK